VPRHATTGHVGAYTRGVRRRFGSLLLLTAVALLLGGCGTNDDEPPATTQATTGTQTETVDGIDPMDDASTDPVTVPATNTETALLTDVRAARHEGYDRVVFEFGNVLPGYDVRYVEKPVHQDGSGLVVPVAGTYVVQVRMENALDADLTQESAPLTYTGPQRLSPGTPEVVELVRTGGFEAVLTWVVGLNDRVDFRVLTLQGPPRLVVDFRNH
jgi:hypothetical protein